MILLESLELPNGDDVLLRRHIDGTTVKTSLGRRQSRVVNEEKISFIGKKNINLRETMMKKCLFSIYGLLPNTSIYYLLLWSILVAVCAVRIS